MGSELRLISKIRSPTIAPCPRRRRLPYCISVLATAADNVFHAVQADVLVRVAALQLIGDFAVAPAGAGPRVNKRLLVSVESHGYTALCKALRGLLQSIPADLDTVDKRANLKFQC